jgi:hypothetical protein
LQDQGPQNIPLLEQLALGDDNLATEAIRKAAQARYQSLYKETQNCNEFQKRMGNL